METVLAEEKWLSEFKRMENELNQSGPLNSALVNAIPDMAFLIHKDGTFLDYYVKDEVRMLAAPEQFLGRKVREIMPPPIADQVFSSFRAAEKSGSMQSFEYDLETDGVENRYECRLVQTGKDNFLCIVRNVTEQRLFLKALSESEKRFEAQYRNNPIPTYIWSKTGDDFVLVDYNYAAEDARPGNAETLLGKKARSWYAEYPVIFEGFSKCFNEKKKIEIELPFRPSKLEEEKYVYLTYVFIPPDLVMLHEQDLTNHKRALKRLQQHIRDFEEAQAEIAAFNEEIKEQFEELESSRAALDRERQRYRELFDSAPDGYLITDRSGVILEANRAAALMLEIEQSRVRGMPILSVVSPEDRKGFRALLAVVQARKGVREFETELLRNRHEVFEAAITVSHVMDDSEEHFRWIVRDITEKKRARRELQQSEEFNRRIIESSNDCIKIVDLDGKILYINPKGEELLEMDDDSCVGAEWLDFWGRAQQELLKPEIEKSRAGGIGRFQGQCRTARGTNKWWDVLITPITDVKGIIVRLLVISRDITEQKLAAEKLLQQERSFRSLIENAHDIVTVLRVDGTVVYESPAVERVLGYSPEKRIGKNCFDYIHPDDLAEVKKSFSAVLETGSLVQPVVYRNRHNDGSIVYLEVVGRLSTDASGEPIVIVNKRDITERVRAEEHMREKEALLRGLIEHIPDGAVIVFDRDFRFLMAEGRELASIGLSSELVKNKSLPDLFPKESVDYLMPFCERAFAGEELWFEFPVYGQAYYLCALPLNMDGDLVSTILVVVRNITEQKQKEDQLEQLSARLLNLQDDERRRLARELHDETAQNLAGLCINLATIKKMIPPDNEKFFALLQESQDLTQKSLREVRTLSYLLHPPTLDEGGLVSALKWFINGFSARSGIRIELVKKGEIGRLAMEIETALYRIVQEGLTNIHRHSGSPTARIELVKEPGKITLRVEDEGCGMPKNIMKNAGGGQRLLGVGIPGMRERLRLLGGNLEIESNENGTTLVATVPLEVIND